MKLTLNRSYKPLALAMITSLLISACSSNTETSTQAPDTNQTAATGDKAGSTKAGSYVELADYNADTAKYANDTKVYFFHASWCPNCQAIDKQIKADGSVVPEGVTIIKTDFDNEQDLREKYGVTGQYTFVQVDNQGNEVAKWRGPSLEKALSGIKI